MDKHKLSKFVHLFENNNRFCLYNSLNLKKHYGDVTLKKIYESFKEPTDLEEFYKQTTLKSEDLDELIEDKILVSENANESDYLNEVVDKEVCKKKDIRVMHMMMATACNYNCVYCCIDHNKDKSVQPKLMSREVAIESVEKFINESENPSYICFFGGEPLVNFKVIKDVVKYVEANYADKDIWFKVNTNGSLITKEVAEFFAKHNFTVGVSIDGLPEIHNKYRVTKDGRGSFNDTITGWWNLHEAGVVQFGIVGVLHADNAKRMEETLDYFINDLEAPTVNWEAVETITHPDYMYLYPTADEVADAFIKTFLRLEKMGAVDNVVTDFLLHFVEDRIRPYRCIIHWGVCVVDVDGVFGPCFNLIGTEHFQYDNFNINDTWMKRSPLTIKDCQSCRAFGVCGGICAAHSHAISNGDIYALHPEYSCAFTQKIVDWMVWDFDARLNKKIS